MSEPRYQQPRDTSSRLRIPLAILGAGGTGAYMAWIAERTGGFRVMGFLDDDPDKLRQRFSGHAVLGTLKQWEELPEDHCMLNSLYGAKQMQRLSSIVDTLDIPDARWATVVDPSAILSPCVSIGVGAFVGAGCVVEPNVDIGRLCALLGNVYIAHDATLGDYAVCANSVSVAGGVCICARSFIGASASIREYVHVGKEAVVGMGSAVIKDVSDRQVVAGNPACPIAIAE